MKVKYKGFIGRRYWTEKSFVDIRFEQIQNRIYKKVYTLHFEFNSYEESQAVWEEIKSERDIWGHIDTSSYYVFIGCFNDSLMKKGGACEKTWFISGYWLDGNGLLRRRIPKGTKVRCDGVYPKLVDKQGIEF